MNETEMMSEIKRLTGQLQQMQQAGQQQVSMLQSGYFAVGGTFRAAVQDLLLALASGDEEDMVAAKKNAKDIVRQWDKGVAMKQEAEEKERAQRSQVILPPNEKKLTVVGPNGEPAS